MFYDIVAGSRWGGADRFESGRRGRFGGGGGDGDGDDFGRVRKLSSEGLQLLILGLLETGPAHGYELIRRLEEHSGGFYAPSPGMIYPALAYLDDADQITAETLGNRKTYRLSADGAQRLLEHRPRVNHLMSRLARIGSRMDDVRDALTGLHEADPTNEALHEARHRLKHALYMKRGCPPEEARRIAAILNRVVDDILHPAAAEPPSSRGSS